MSTLALDQHKPAVAFNYPREIIRIFSESDCWKLAQTINADAGFGIITAQGNDGFWCHAANLLPDGRILDIFGIWEEAEWVALWQKYTDENSWSGIVMGVFPWTRSAFEDEVYNCMLDHPQLSDEEVLSYAREIVSFTGIPALV